MRKTLAILIIGASALMTGVASASTFVVEDVSKIKTLIAETDLLVLVDNDFNSSFQAPEVLLPVIDLVEPMSLQVFLPVSNFSYIMGEENTKYHPRYLFNPPKVPA